MKVTTTRGRLYGRDHWTVMRCTGKDGPWVVQFARSTANGYHLDPPKPTHTRFVTKKIATIAKRLIAGTI